MLEPTTKNTENYLAYGSIVSLMLDYNSSNTFSTISYDPKGGNNKNTDKEDDQGSNLGSISDRSITKKGLKKIKTIKKKYIK